MNRIKLTAATALLGLGLLLGLSPAALASSINTLTVTDWNKTSGVNVTLYGNYLGTKTGAEFYVHMDLGNNNFQDVVGYCTDLYQTIDKGPAYTSYNLYSSSTSPTWSSSQQAAAWLLGHYDPGLGNPYTGNLTTTVTALQVAIWEVTYDYSSTGNYYLGYGNIKFNSLDSTIAALANSYLSALGSAQRGGTVALNGLNFAGAVGSDYKQDLIVGNVAIGATPEPGSMLLFGSAAGLLGWLRRRKAQTSREGSQTA
jgi:hypothetical protein